ncbi:MAG TPA: dihydroorotase [Bauldia sp.]|nr:dihydroorotase [Bauldia sp.]
MPPACSTMTDTITIRTPDDWHVHLRDGAMLRAVLPFTARSFARAIVMPNLVPPVVTTADAAAYRERILAALPDNTAFTPLMTAYLRDDTDPDDIEAGYRDGVLTAVKFYPAHATTNAAAGVTDIARVRPVLARMEKIGMPLLIHGEDVGPDVDIFDREAVFVERRLAPLLRDFPGLRVVLEHLSTEVAVAFVRANAPRLAGTITPHHLAENRTKWLGYGLRPHLYCMPVIKKESDRLALVAAATSGEACFFLGTDSAPHALGRKLAPVCAAGVFNAPVALETYAGIFAEVGRLDRLEAFASLNGPRHYGLPENKGTVTLVRTDWTAPESAPVDGPEVRVAAYRGGETIAWRIAGRT